MRAEGRRRRETGGRRRSDGGRGARRGGRVAGRSGGTRCPQRVGLNSSRASVLRATRSTSDRPQRGQLLQLVRADPRGRTPHTPPRCLMSVFDLGTNPAAVGTPPKQTPSNPEIGGCLQDGVPTGIGSAASSRIRGIRLRRPVPFRVAELHKPLRGSKSATQTANQTKSRCFSAAA